MILTCMRCGSDVCYAYVQYVSQTDDVRQIYGQVISHNCLSVRILLIRTVCAEISS